MKKLLLSLLCATVASAATKTNLTFGVNEGSAPGQAEQQMAAVLRHLNESPSITVKLKVYPTHDALYDAFRAREIDFVLLGAVKYVEAHNDIGAIPLVAEGATSRTSIVVPSASPIRKVEELRGKRFAFGYRDSTSTHLIPALLLSKHGLKESDVVGSFGGHQPQKIVDEMLAGKYDACAASEMTREQNKAKLRALDTSDPFPGPPIVVRQDMPPALRDVLRDAFVSYKPDPSDHASRFAKGAVATTDADYNRIRFLCKVLFNKTYH